MEDIKEQVTIILLNQGWTKKVISVPGEVHFTKSINAFMLIEVVVTSNQNNFLNISIYNTTGIGKEHIIQKYSKIFSQWNIQSIAMRLDSTMILMLIEDVVVEFIKGILQKK